MEVRALQSVTLFPQVSYPLWKSFSFFPHHSNCSIYSDGVYPTLVTHGPLWRASVTLPRWRTVLRRSFQVITWWERAGRVRGHLFTLASSLIFQIMSSMQARASSLESCPPTGKRQETYIQSRGCSFEPLYVLRVIIKQKKISSNLSSTKKRQVGLKTVLL